MEYDFLKWNVEEILQATRERTKIKTHVWEMNFKYTNITWSLRKQMKYRLLKWNVEDILQVTCEKTKIKNLGIKNLTRAVCKVRGLNLLLRVGTLWRYGDGLFSEVPPLASDALLTTLHPLLESVLQTVDHLEISCLEAPFSWLEKPRNRMGRDLDCMVDVLVRFHRSTFSKPNTEFSSDLWAFPTMKRELRGMKFRSDQRSAARFREVGGAL
jgi:hypothetical protein